MYLQIASNILREEERRSPSWRRKLFFKYIICEFVYITDLDFKILQCVTTDTNPLYENQSQCKHSMQTDKRLLSVIQNIEKDSCKISRTSNVYVLQCTVVPNEWVI
jgi:hypothetical protein